MSASKRRRAGFLLAFALVTNLLYVRTGLLRLIGTYCYTSAYMPAYFQKEYTCQGLTVWDFSLMSFIATDQPMDIYCVGIVKDDKTYYMGWDQTGREQKIQVFSLSDAFEKCESHVAEAKAEAVKEGYSAGQASERARTRVDWCKAVARNFFR